MFIFRKRGVIGLPDNFPHSKFVFYDFPIQKKIGCLRLQASDSSLSKSSTDKLATNDSGGWIKFIQNGTKTYYHSFQNFKIHDWIKNQSFEKNRETCMFRNVQKQFFNYFKKWMECVLWPLVRLGFHFGVLLTIFLRKYFKIIHARA